MGCRTIVRPRPAGSQNFRFELVPPPPSLFRMTQALPTVTVLIAARPQQVEVLAVNAARRLDYPADRLEIIVARGKQPSVQRNTALRAAKGDLIYFLDDDSEPPKDALRRAVTTFADPRVQMLGGPNLCPASAPALEQVFAVVHASWLAFGPSRARYAAVGKIRPTSEKELILCNLIARRAEMLALGGFDEALYPNEENALMDEIQKRDGQLIYDPDLYVHRRPRHSLGAFCKMLRNYGRGRAEQFRLHSTWGSAPNFVPPLFCVYLLVFPVVGLLGLQHWYLLLAPLSAYFLALLLQTAFLIPGYGLVNSVAALPLMALTHILYGIGFWNGLFFTSLKPAGARPKVEVVLERLNALA